jgi:hypothetical protein
MTTAVVPASRLSPQNAAALAALVQTPNYFNGAQNLTSTGLRWDQYVSLREQGFIIERPNGGVAPDVAITVNGIAASNV